MFTSRKLDYLRIVLFIPIAWAAYNISMHLIIKLPNTSIIEAIGTGPWRYGIDIIQLLVFSIAATIIAPKAVRIWCGILSVFVYIFSYFYSNYVLPTLLNNTIENNTLKNLSNVNYLVSLIILLVVVAASIYQYQKRINQNK